MQAAPTIQSREVPHVLIDNVMRWSVYNEEKGLFFNGYVMDTPAGAYVVDPPSADERVFAGIEQHFGRPAAVVVTNRDHERASDAFRQRYSCPVMASEADCALLEIPAEERLQETLPGGWKVLSLVHQKSPGEVALFNVEKRMLLLGDALISKQAGVLTMLPAEKYADPSKAREGLNVLQSLDVDVILPGDGEPVLQGGKQVLAQFFSGV